MITLRIKGVLASQTMSLGTALPCHSTRSADLGLLLGKLCKPKKNRKEQRRGSSKATEHFASFLFCLDLSGLLSPRSPSLLSPQWEIIDTASHFFFFFFFFFVFSRATPVAYRGNQARGPIRASAASPCHSHSNVESEPCL